jgi:hypothetical protein
MLAGLRRALEILREFKTPGPETAPSSIKPREAEMAWAGSETAKEYLIQQIKAEIKIAEKKEEREGKTCH